MRRVVHTSRVFSELSQQDADKTAGLASNLKQRAFLDALPDEFDRQDYVAVAKTRELSTSTAEKWICAFCLDGVPLEKVQHGRYRKKSTKQVLHRR